MCMSRVPTNPGDKIVRVFLFFGEFISYTILLVLVLVSLVPFSSLEDFISWSLSLSLFFFPLDSRLNGSRSLALALTRSRVTRCFAVC